MAQLSATGPEGCVVRGSRCKVNDGVDVNVAVDVKVGVKVIVEDKVKFRPLPEQGRGVLQDIGSDRRQERDAGDLG